MLIASLVFAIMGAACFRNVGHYTAEDGSTIYVGVFHNDQPGVGFGPAEIKGTLFDASGNAIGTAGGFLCLGVDLGADVPFKAWTFTDASKVARVEWSIVDPPAAPYLATGLEANVTTTFEAAGKTYVVGEVTNNSKNVYVAAVVCASWTDKDGTVIREAWNNGGAWRFNPGDKVPFSLPVDTLPPGAAIHFYLDAGVTNIPGDKPATAVDIPTGALQHAWQKTTGAAGGSFVTVGMGEVKNSGSSHFLPDAVAVVKDSSGKILATRGDPSDCMVTAPPGGFTYMTYTVIAPVAKSPNVTLQGLQTNDRTVYFPQTSAVDFKLDDVKQTVTVTGTLTNTATVVLKQANVCAGVYDSGGTVRGVGMANLDVGATGIAPGATAPFTIVIRDPGGITKAKAIADGFAR
jgi:hypothetical protein